MKHYRSQFIKRLQRARIKRAWQTLPWKDRPKQFSNNYLHRFNVHEEILNSITHGAGIFLAVVALILMIVNADLHQSIFGIVSGAVFGSALVIAYTSSAVYHAVFYPPLKQVFKVVDHASIFLLIAGTYTPFCLVTLHGALGWTMFGIVWSMAVSGVILKLFFVDRYETLSTIIYLVMGWIAVAVCVPLFNDLSFYGVLWLVAGGLFYTLGVVFFLLERYPFFHTIWHLFVLAGSFCHFIAVWHYVMPVVV